MPNSRGQSSRAVGIPIPEIRIMYDRALTLNIYEGELGSLKLEAFLALATLLEGVLTQLGLLLLQRDEDIVALRGKRKNRYGIDSAIDDLYLLKKISTAEFKALERFKADRNRCIHELFRKKGDAQIQQYAGGLFVQHRPIFDVMFSLLLHEME